MLPRPIRYLARILQHRLTGKRIPALTVLTVTPRCNFRCRYCFGQYGKSPGGDYTTAELFSLVDELAAAGTVIVSLSGGEPLLREDIGAVIDRIRSRGMMCLMNTNGSLVEKRLEDLGGLDGICLGLDGNEPDNDRNRGEGTYRRIRQGLTAAKKLGKPLHVACVLTIHNLGGIDFLVEEAKREDFSAEFNLPCGLFAETNDAGVAAYRDYREAVGKILQYQQRGYPILFSQSTYRLLARWLECFDRPLLPPPPPPELPGASLLCR